MLNYIILIIGFVMLIKGADVFVDSASGIAKRFGIPSMIIGLTVVAMGTSAPELSVSICSSLSGMNDMSIANVVGSNIFNILVVLGISSMVNKLKITNYKDVITLLLSSILLFICVMDGSMARYNGLILLGAFIIFILKTIKSAKENNEEVNEVKEQKSLTLTLALGVIGLAAIIWGGDLVVDSASKIALQLGMSENLVGLTVVALGTSLPEFVTSVIATKKGEVDIAVGNVLGSNIFNILLILGCAATINPMLVSTFALMDVMFMLLSVMIFVLITFRSKTISKLKGIPMIILYVLYIMITIIR